jgi:hypothetical protein
MREGGAGCPGASRAGDGEGDRSKWRGGALMESCEAHPASSSAVSTKAPGPACRRLQEDRGDELMERGDLPYLSCKPRELEAIAPEIQERPDSYIVLDAMGMSAIREMMGGAHVLLADRPRRQDPPPR